MRKAPGASSSTVAASPRAVVAPVAGVGIPPSVFYNSRPASLPAPPALLQIAPPVRQISPAAFYGSTAASPRRPAPAAQLLDAPPPLPDTRNTWQSPYSQRSAALEQPARSSTFVPSGPAPASAGFAQSGAASPRSFEIPAPSPRSPRTAGGGFAGGGSGGSGGGRGGAGAGGIGVSSPLPANPGNAPQQPRAESISRASSGRCKRPRKPHTHCVPEQTSHCANIAF